jgi:hypothetical protein
VSRKTKTGQTRASEGEPAPASPLVTRAKARGGPALPSAQRAQEIAARALTNPQVAELEQQLLECVPPQGFIGNPALRAALGWDEARYWYVRNRLLLSGALIAGRGRGGSVQRVVPVPSSASAGAPTEEAGFLNKRSEYIPDTSRRGGSVPPIVTTVRNAYPETRRCPSPKRVTLVR